MNETVMGGNAATTRYAQQDANGKAILPAPVGQGNERSRTTATNSPKFVSLKQWAAVHGVPYSRAYGWLYGGHIRYAKVMHPRNNSPRYMVPAGERLPVCPTCGARKNNGHINKFMGYIFDGVFIGHETAT